ncbi:hypothetical protein HY844_00525 [Candidatus Berkelbacteria bacterium]|nr:hypothetical protein [Candidatus Berkelbacteria bacterium]
MNNYGRFLESLEFEVVDPHTPRRWVNTVNGDIAESNVDQTGGGSFSAMIDEQVVEIIAKNNLFGGRLFYLKDFYSGKIWCPTWLPKKSKLENFSTVHGFNKSEIRSLGEQLEFNATFSTSKNNPAERYQIKLKNLSAEKRRIHLYIVVEILGEQIATAKKMGEALHFTKRKDKDLTYFVSADREIRSFDTSLKSFIGEYPSSDLGEFIDKQILSKTTGDTNSPLAVMEFAFNLGSGSSSDLTVLCGAVKNLKGTTVNQQITTIAKGEFVSFNKNTEFILNSPDKDLNKLLNGFYFQKLQSLHLPIILQKGVESLANSLCASMFISRTSAKKIAEQLLCNQSTDGLWQNSYSLSLKSLFAITKYVNYLGFEELKTSYKYSNDTEATLFEHVIKTLKSLLDAKNELTTGEKAQLVVILYEVIAAFEQSNHHSIAKKYWDDLQQLNAEISKAKTSNFLADKTWPIISKSVTEGEKTMKHFAKTYVTTAPPNITTPYIEFDPKNIYSQFNPGEFSNGAIDALECADLIIAATSCAQGDYAWRLVGQILPIFLGVNADRYKAEPFRQSALISAKPSANYGEAITDDQNLEAKVYAVIYQQILGLNIVNGSIKIDPCVPRDWKNLEFSYKLHEASYHFRIQNPFRVSKGIDRVIVDGVRITGNVIRPMRSGVHFVEVILG